MSLATVDDDPIIGHFDVVRESGFGWSAALCAAQTEICCMERLAGCGAGRFDRGEDALRAVGCQSLPVAMREQTVAQQSAPPPGPDGLVRLDRLSARRKGPTLPRHDVG